MSAINRIVIQFVTTGGAAAVSSIRAIGAAAKSTSTDMDFLKRSMLAIGGAFSVKAIFDTVDAYATLQNRIKLVTSSQEELIDVHQGLFEVSQRTRSDLVTNAALMTKLATSTVEQKLSFEELLKITETLNQAIAISGATAFEAKAGLIQLSQGLALGTLRAQDLRSVVEELPAVADMIAKHYGVARGALAHLGGQGLLTTSGIIASFREAAVEVGERFAKSIVTPRQAMILLNNSFITFTGRLFEAVAATQAFENLLRGISRWFDRVGLSLKQLADETAENRSEMSAFGLTIQIVEISLAAIVAGTIISGLLSLGAALFTAATAATLLQSSLAQVLVVLTSIVSLSFGSALYNQFPIIQTVANATFSIVALVMENFVALFDVIIKGIFGVVRAFANVTLEVVATALSALSKLASVAAKIPGLKPVAGFSATVLAGEANLLRSVKSTEAETYGGVDAAFASHERRVQGIKTLWRTVQDDIDRGSKNKRDKGLLSSTASEISSVIDSVLAFLPDKVEAAFKKGVERMKQLGGLPNVMGPAAHSTYEFSTAQKNASNSIEDFIENLQFESDVIRMNSAEKQQSTSLRKLEGDLVKAEEANLKNLAEAKEKNHEGDVALIDTQNQRDRGRYAILATYYEQLAVERELEEVALDKSMKADTVAAAAEAEAIRDLSHSMGDASKIIKFTDEANRRFGAGTTAADDAIKAYTKSIENNVAAAALRARQEELSTSIKSTLDDLILQRKAIDDTSRSLKDAAAIIKFSAQANELYGESTALATKKIKEFITAYEGNAAAETLRARQDDLRKSIKGTLDDLILERKAIDDASRSFEDAAAIIKFSAEANELYGESTAFATNKIKEFIAAYESNKSILKERDKNKRLDDSMLRSTDGLRQEGESLRNFTRSAESAKAILEFTAEANERFGVGTKKASDAIGEFTQLLDQTEGLQAFRALVEDIATNISQSFEDIIFQSKSVGQAVEDMVKQVAQAVFQELVTKQIAGFLTSVIGGGSSGGGAGGFAKLLGFAEGGIINRPTFLGLADGHFAIGGESGPEAVVPLPDGRRIPVQMYGGESRQQSVNVTMNISTPNAESFRRTERQITDSMMLRLRRQR